MCFYIRAWIPSEESGKIKAIGKDRPLIYRNFVFPEIFIIPGFSAPFFMKNAFLSRSLLLAASCSLALLLSCGNSNGQSQQTNLAPQAFSQKIAQLPNEVILDVRTPTEYADGHIEGARNIDWNAPNFKEGISTLDKSTPVLVYCLSGGRSSEAAAALRKAGFKQVYELKGGMLAWRQESLPEATVAADENLVQTVETTGMTRAQYDSLIASDKAILVDFYAEWCGPCKKMKPSLDELSQELAGKVRIERIDVDKNEALGNDLGIVGLPTLVFYKKGKQVWKQMGFMTKEQLKSKLK